jgi:isopentenyl-diphosphate delta-isomerase type 1
MPDELLDVVNDADAVTSQSMRSVVHERGLLHRGVHILLFTPDGKLLIQKRSANRRQYASLWDCSVSEHVKAGESYHKAAQRGLQEELGVTGIDLQPLVKFKMNYGQNDNEISIVFQSHTDSNEVYPDPVEIDSVHWLSVDELKNMMDRENSEFSGWFLEIMHWYWGKPSALIVLQRWQDNPGQIDI